MSKISALELAYYEDKYGTENVNAILNTATYNEEFKNWIDKMEESSKSIEKGGCIDVDN